MENYNTIISIEANTMVDMIRHDILPAVSAFGDHLCQRAYHKETMSVSCKYEKATAAQISQLTDALLDACVQLEQDLSAVPANPQEAMTYSHQVITVHMAEARAVADQLETLTAREFWPFPVYEDLLFSV